MSKREKAMKLTRAELDAMTTGALTAVAQAVGTSGRYESREELLARILRQQREGSDA